MPVLGKFFKYSTMTNCERFLKSGQDYKKINLITFWGKWLSPGLYTKGTRLSEKKAPQC